MSFATFFAISSSKTTVSIGSDSFCPFFFRGKMPKHKETISSFYRRMTIEFPNVFRTDGSVLFCLACDTDIPAKQRCQVKQHLETSKHISSLTRKNKSGTSQALLTTLADSGRNTSNFTMDLAKCFLESNIPLHKIRHPSVVEFLENYTKYTVPSEFTLRNNCLPKIFDDCVEKMKDIAADRYIWASVDETTDCEQRAIVNLVFGILGVEEQRGRSYLFASEVLEDAVNSSTIAQFFDETINQLSK